jgi:hypothetical protein
MKITRRQLRQLIKEELGRLDETDSDRVEKLDPNLLKGAYVSSKADREAMKDYIAKLKAKKKSMGLDGDTLDDDYPAILGYKHPETGEQVMISVQSSDDMDDILDPLLRQYPDLPYSVD